MSKSLVNGKGDGLDEPVPFKTVLGLENVDNTADVDKPVSTAQQAAIDAVAKGAVEVFESTQDALFGEVYYTAETLQEITFNDPAPPLTPEYFTVYVNNNDGAVIGGVNYGKGSIVFRVHSGFQWDTVAADPTRAAVINEGGGSIAQGSDNPTSEAPNFGDNTFISGENHGGNFGESCHISGDGVADAKVVSSGATGDQATDIITSVGHGLNDGDLLRITMAQGGVGLTGSIWYYVVNASTDGFQVSTTLGGSAQNIVISYSNIGYIARPFNRGDYCSFSGRGTRGNDLSYARIHGGGVNARLIELAGAASTTDATAKDITLGGETFHPGSNPFVNMAVPRDSAWAFTATVVAKVVGSSGSKIMRRQGIIENNGGTVAISSIDTIGSDSVIGTITASVLITAGATFDTLNVEVTGAAAQTTNWAARVELTQVND